MKWVLELAEFEVLYKPCIAIEGQALADFLVEFTHPEDPDEEVAPSELRPELQPIIPTWGTLC